MVSVKWKFLLILILSIFATAAGVYITQHQPSTSIIATEDEQPTPFSVMNDAENQVIYPERVDYKTIPLTRFNSVLQGSNPVNLALNAVEDIASTKGTRKVEKISYPQANQAVVIITQTVPNSQAVKAVKYRVEVNTFGRSLLVSSPPVWEIVWVGSQIQCKSESNPDKKFTQSCEKKDER